MSLPVIPAPVRFDPADGRFTPRPGTPVTYSQPALAPFAERFCAEVTRRTGQPLVSQAGPDGPIRIDLVAVPGLPAPQGVSPGGGVPPDERYALTIEPAQVVLRAPAPAGVARGLTTLVQLLAAARSLPCGRILDAPRYAWRGLSLDLARTYFTLDQVRRIIDLLALYKLNVLHLHLTDDQAWRLPVPGPAGPDSYSAGDLAALAGYAADRFVTVIPEVDMPGHAAALARLRPGLAGAWLDPTKPATFSLVEEVLAGVAGIFPAPFLHIGADESGAMPHELYTAFVRRARDIVRSLGKRPLAWQESARAGLGPDDLIQYWISGTELAPSTPPDVRARLAADLTRSRTDLQTAAAAAAPVIASPQKHCYLDAPHAGAPADSPVPATQAAQVTRQARVGLPLYAPQPVSQSFTWDPAETFISTPSAPNAAPVPGPPQVAGVEAAVWAETVTDFADLSFLLLPRLPGVAHRAWSPPDSATWPDHRDHLARHARLWDQDNLTYFRSAEISWP